MVELFNGTKVFSIKEFSIVETTVLKEVNLLVVVEDKVVMFPFAVESPLLKEVIRERFVLTEVLNNPSDTIVLDKENDVEALTVFNVTFVAEIAVDKEVTLATTT